MLQGLDNVRLSSHGVSLSSEEENVLLSPKLILPVILYRLSLGVNSNVCQGWNVFLGWNLQLRKSDCFNYFVLCIHINEGMINN